MTELEKKLQRFENEDFIEACFDLIKYWKIKNIPYEASDFSAKDFFSDRFSSSHESFIGKIKDIELLCVATPDTFAEDPENVNFEELLSKDGYNNMMFFGIEIYAEMNRTEISHLTRAFNRINHNFPVILFIKRYDSIDNCTKLTLSMCERTEKIRIKKDGEKIPKSLKIGRVTILRDINCKAPHTGHINILQKLSVSCNSFNELYSKWLEIFSNELLTKDFYGDLYKWYQWAIEPSTGVTFPNIVGDSQDDTMNTSTSIIRLITRILFVWFIKQKGLAPDELFNVEKLPSILSNFNPNSNQESTYYNAILQNLFFATLNNQIERRAFADISGENNPHEGVKTLFRDNDKKSWFSISHDEVLKIFRPIPFMNCGLFECLDKYANADIDTNMDNFMDGFSCKSDKVDGNFKYRAFVPNNLFFAKEHKETVSVVEKGKVKHEVISVAGLLPIFNKYQFTVEENTPTDVEVSLDPELLGQVFENLLAAYDPKTRSTARKATGSFYTPRKIVEYMVNESLVEYLDSQVDPTKDDVWRTILGYEDIPFTLSADERKNVLEKLLNCKILDPACGSGAFPMGMLHQMVHAVRKIDPTNEIWRDLVLERTKQEIDRILLERKDSKDANKDLENRRSEVMKAFDNSVDNPDYTRKLYIIQNCIYGSDIQPIAMLISKLRFFISLICEQDTRNLNYDDAEHNYGIDTLPNLETKFVAADSLANAKVRDFEDDEWTIDKNLVHLKNELLQIRQSHFMANTQEKKLAKRNEDESKLRDIHNYIINQVIRPDEARIKEWTDKIAALEKERQSCADERLAEVEVTTQANLFEEAKTEYIIKDINKEKRDIIDKTIRSLERNIIKEKNKENKAGFVNAVNQITSWNPYDQINPAPFFDPDWMFNVKDGFDIVIGNPPYFQIPKGIYSAQQYPFSEGKDPGKQNMYKLFVEHSYNNVKNNGIACMIVQSSLMCDMSSKNTRELLLNNTELKKVIEFPKIAPTKEGQVFASVCQGTCIYLFCKQKPMNRSFMLSVNNDCTTLDKMLIEYINNDELINLYPEDFAIPLLRPQEFPLLKTIKKHSTMLKEYVKSFAKGDMNLGTYGNKIKQNDTGIKLLRGANIFPYHTDYNVAEFISKGFRSSYVKNNNSTRFLLWRDISGTVDPRRIISSISDTSENALFGDTVNKIELKDEKYLPYFEALFNSKLFDWVFRKTSSNNHASCSEILLLPINIPKDLSEVDTLVSQRKSLTDEDTSSVNERLDTIIFDAYGLSNDERQIILGYYN